ncbi:MAG: polyhydroxybutyrate depolymerase, partial [Pseudomonadota bacterium]
GAYHITLPDGPGPHPAMIFLHGFGSSGKGALRMGGPIVERGYAMIGPDGLSPPGGRSRWGLPVFGDGPRSELGFIREVIAHAADTHAIDPGRIILAGFSLGGSMATYLACEDADLAQAYAPIAGGFWRPHPELDACSGPVSLFHTHGWRDRTVPLEGRPLRADGSLIQGDIFYTLQVWRQANGCRGLRADTFSTDENYWRRGWDSCAAGHLEFAMFPGAHGIPRGWADMILDWVEGL